MKGLPNLVTSIRAAASGALIFTAPFSAAFWALYALAGLSDMLDGFLARGLHAETAAGARLDSAADFCFLAVCAAKLLPVLRLPGWRFSCSRRRCALFPLRRLCRFCARWPRSPRRRSAEASAG